MITNRTKEWRQAEDMKAILETLGVRSEVAFSEVSGRVILNVYPNVPAEHISFKVEVAE